jgi:hypothetical protein
MYTRFQTLRDDMTHIYSSKYSTVERRTGGDRVIQYSITAQYSGGGGDYSSITAEDDGCSTVEDAGVCMCVFVSICVYVCVY